MPQLPHFLCPQIEIFSTSLVQLTQNCSIVSKVKAKHFSDLSKKPCNNLVKLFVHLEEKITGLIKEDSPLSDVPKTCPDACNPVKIYEDTAIQGALAALRVGLPANGIRNPLVPLKLTILDRPLCPTTKTSFLYIDVRLMGRSCFGSSDIIFTYNRIYCYIPSDLQCPIDRIFEGTLCPTNKTLFSPIDVQGYGKFLSQRIDHSYFIISDLLFIT